MTNQTQPQEPSMIQRTQDAFKSRMNDIRILNELRLMEQDHENDYPNIIEEIKNKYGSPDEYGLSLDFVEEGTFTDQKEPYIRFQLSWGGPSEEFRIYATNEIEFWFMDWYTGEHKNLDDEEKEQVFSFLSACDYNELKDMLGVKEQ